MHVCACSDQQLHLRQPCVDLLVLQPVDLLPLPEGVPELLPVTCNGRSGLMVVRTQKVQHGDAEVSASKFEQVCGKGDAKKWKCSIWTEAADGTQDTVSNARLQPASAHPKTF